MWCFAVSVGVVNNDFTVSVVCFDVAGTLKQKVGVALPASADPPPRRQFDEFDKVRKFWLPTVSVGDPAAKRQLPLGSNHHGRNRQ